MENLLFTQRERYVRIPIGAKIVAVLAVGLLAALSASCDLGLEEPDGAVEVTVGSVSTLVMEPDQSMDVVSFRLLGDGPDGNELDEGLTEGTTRFDGLESGEWSFEVIGFNESGTDIAVGSAQTEVVAGETASVSITVEPYDGPGTLSVSITWPAEDVTDPALEGELTSSDGTNAGMSADITGEGTAAIAHGEVSAGYHTLSVQLLDGDTVVAGAAETVRIAQDAETSGTVAFSDVNPPTGDVEIIVDPELDEPLPVTIEGGAEELAMGESMTVAADTSNADGAEVSYTWYVNGAYVSQGAETTVGADLEPGSYRLDVVAFTEDGSRSGSASHTFTVTE
ncbi:MAG: hypothetical protein ACLFS5_07645 [Spirochaetaceae bacterium]